MRAADPPGPDQPDEGWRLDRIEHEPTTIVPAAPGWLLDVDDDGPLAIVAWLIGGTTDETTDAHGAVVVHSRESELPVAVVRFVEQSVSYRVRRPSGPAPNVG